jgi:putative component of membrane protein insertase Oxa1/YidC/SpoIIIJ protein YidD
MIDRRRPLRAIAAVWALVWWTGCAAAGGPGPCGGGPRFAPWDDARAAAPSPADAPSGAADAMIGAYQRHLRRPELPGGGCPFAPTCSVFTRDALGRYGALGVILAVDRLLIREHAFLHGHYPVACVDGRERFGDPVP